MTTEMDSNDTEETKSALAVPNPLDRPFSVAEEEAAVFRVPSGEPTVSVADANLSTDITEGSTVVPLACSYTAPSWAGFPEQGYALEVVRNGIIVNRIDLSSSSKSYFIIGRLPDQCDISTENPSCSRFHAVLQFGQKESEKNKGFYLYDLNSTHGTFLNKARIQPETYQRVHTGFVMKFGQSTRLYVVQGPAEDEEEESPLSIAEMKAARTAALEQKTDEAVKQDPGKETEDSGIDWGFGTDASDEVEEKEVGFLEAAVSGDDSYFRDDPKKALNTFFLREGMDMEYDVEEIGQGHKKQFLCRIPLPIETANGRQLVAEATVHGKKKEALAAAMLEACRILHAKGILKGTTSVGRQRKSRNWADEDYYDSDEDAYLDRTGTVERKRQQRMQRAKTSVQKAETFDSLSQRLEDVKNEMSEVADKLQLADKNKAASMGDGGLDALDSFMDAIKSGLIMDPKTKIKLRQRLSELKLEEARLIKLINIVRPLDLPPILPSLSSKPVKPEPESVAEGFSYGRLKAAPLPPKAAPVYDHGKDETFRVEEDEEEVVKSEVHDQSLPAEMVNTAVSAVTTPNDDENPGNVERKRKVSENTDEDKVVSSGVIAEVKPYLPESKKKRNKKGTYEYDASDPDYAVWIPPEGQTGDGRTNLNARLGY